MQRYLLSGMIVVWLIFIFLLFMRPAPFPDQNKTSKNLWGLVLQVLAFGMLFWGQRPLFTPLFRWSETLQTPLVVGCLGLALASLWLIGRSFLQLRQWQYDHRKTPGAREVLNTGAFRFVRHPFFAGLLGLLLTTGFTLSTKTAFLLALITYAAGTWFRIQAEEADLRARFGAVYEDYAARVPMLFPKRFA